MSYVEGTTVIVHPDGRTEPAAPADGRYFSLEEMQRIVGGDIEIAAQDDRMVMIVNETGLLDHLPANPTATRIWRGLHPGIADVVVGTVLFCQQSQLEP